MEAFETLLLKNEQKDLLSEIQKSYNVEDLQIAFLGEFSVGKTALINTILEKELLPTHANETTAIPTKITYSDKPESKLILNSGKSIVVDESEIMDIKAKRENIEDVNYLEIKMSEPKWLKGVEIIDTPGRNSKYKTHVEASKKAIIEADVCVYVMLQKGLSIADIVYIQEILQYQKQIIFVVNKMDLMNDRNEIEEVLLLTKDNLKEQLGLDFTVLPSSIKDEALMANLFEIAITQSKADKNNLKKARLDHAISQLLKSHIIELTNEIEKLKLLSETDAKTLEYKKKELDSQIESEELSVEQFNAGVKKELLNEKNKIIDLFDRKYLELKQKLYRNIANYLNMDEETIKTDVTVQLVKLQEELRDLAYNRINIIVEENVNYSPSEISKSNIDLGLQNYDYSDLLAAYQERKEYTLNEFEKKQQVLKMKATQDNKDDKEIIQLEKELKILQEEMNQKYVPQYYKDLPDDVKQNEKILNIIGAVGDIALSTAFAVITGGASVATQVGSQAAKEGAKQAGKQATKQTAKNIAKRAGKEAVKNASIKVMGKIKTTLEDEKVQKRMKKGVDSFNETIKSKREQLEQDTQADSEKGNMAVSILSFVTSPVQTIAGNIGKSLDKDAIDNASMKEDLNYRSEFLHRKNELVKQFQEKQNRLNQMKQDQKLQDRQIAKIEEKIHTNQNVLEEKTKELEASYHKEVEQQQSEHKKEQLRIQLEKIIENENKVIDEWLEIEIQELMNIIKNATPALRLNHLNDLKQQLESVNIDDQQKKEEAKQEIKKIQIAIENTNTYLGEING